MPNINPGEGLSLQTQTLLQAADDTERLFEPLRGFPTTTLQVRGDSVLADKATTRALSDAHRRWRAGLGVQLRDGAQIAELLRDYTHDIAATDHHSATTLTPHNHHPATISPAHPTSPTSSTSPASSTSAGGWRLPAHLDVAQIAQLPRRGTAREESDSVRELAAAWRRLADVLDRTGNTIRVEVGTFQGTLAERYQQVRDQLRRALLRASDAAATFATAMDRLADTFEGIAAEERDIALAQLHPSPRDIPTDERVAALLTEFHTAQTRARTAIGELSAAAPTTALLTTPTPTPTSTAAPAAADQPGTQPGVRTDPAGTHTAAAGPAIPDPAPHAPPAPTPSGKERWAPNDPRWRRYVIVGPPSGGIHDTLARIAARTLHNPRRWPEIYQLNHGLPQPGGHTLTFPHLIHPGWYLAIPDTPPEPSAPTHPDPSRCPPVHTPPYHPDTGVRIGPPGHGISPTEGVFLGVGALGLLGAAGWALTKPHTTHTPTPPTTRPDPDTDPPRVYPLHPDNHNHTGTHDHPGTHTDTNDYTGTDDYTGPEHRDERDGQTPPSLAPDPGHTPEADPGRTTTTVTPTNPQPHPTTTGEPALPEAGHPSTSELPTPQPDTDLDISDSDSEQVSGWVIEGDQPDGLVRDLGIKHDQVIIGDLCAFHGLSLTGPGAHDALRASIIDLLTAPTPARPIPAARVIIPAPLAHTLLDPTDPNPDPAPDPGLELVDDTARRPAGLVITPDLDTALDQLEIVLLRRSREHHQPDHHDGAHNHDGATAAATTGWEPLVLIAEVNNQHPRLQTILELGGAYAITAIVHGPWEPGTTCHLTHDGTITASLGPAGAALLRTRLYTLPPTRTHQLLTHLAEHTNTGHTNTGHTNTGHTSTAAHEENATREGSDDTEGDGRQRREHTASHSGDPREPRDLCDLTAHDEPPVPEPPRSDPVTDDPRNGKSIDEILNPALHTPPTHPDPDTPERGETQQDEKQQDEKQQGQTQQGQTDTSSVLASTEASTDPLPAVAPVPAVGPVPVLGPVPGAPAEALVVIRALGRLTVYARTRPGDPLCNITTEIPAGQLQLLGCLAARPGPSPTGSLLAACWPEIPAEKAVPRLYSTASRLRTILRAATSTDIHGEGGGEGLELLCHIGESYQLDPRYCWVDYHALDTALTQARAQLAIDPDLYRHTLTTAVALYTGPLLDTLHSRYEWVEAVREATRRRVINAASTLADHHSPTNPERAGAFLATAHTLDPTDNHLTQQLIRHHHAQHNPDAAYRVYTAHTRALTDLDLRPQPDTTALLHQPPG